MNTLPKGSRITFKEARPNPLFHSWLEELHKEAVENNSSIESELKEALAALSKYPLPLESGAECAILKGFDKKLCSYLDKRLELYNYNKNLLTNAPSSSSDTETYGLDNPERNDHFLQTSPIQVPTRSTADLQGSVEINLITENQENADTQNSHATSIKTTKRKCRSRNMYKPAVRSGGYAILVALLEHLNDNPESPALKKEELIAKAQVHSEESFTRPKPDSFYTAWSNMSRLITKGLVDKRKNKKLEYLLTDQGVLIAKELLKDSASIPTANDIIFNNADPRRNNTQDDPIVVDKPMSRHSTISPATACNLEDTVIEMSPGTFDVILLIDKCETSGSVPTYQTTYIKKKLWWKLLMGTQALIHLVHLLVILTPQFPQVTSRLTVFNVLDQNQDSSFCLLAILTICLLFRLSKKNDPTVAQFNKYPDLKHEYRSLKVGDFMWVARNKINTDQELVLPYIVERKRMDDLGASIKDGRFHEQKFRLRKSGLKNVIYMVENYGSNKHVGLPVQSLMQALQNTRVQDDFKVHVTDSLTSSARFLAMLTKRLTIEYKDKNLRGYHKESQGDNLMTFSFLNKVSSKTKPLTVTETFIKILLQLKGVSVEKALAITEIYRTPHSLIEVYQECSQTDGEFLLANLKCGNSNRNVGPTVSKSIYNLFSNIDLA